MADMADKDIEDFINDLDVVIMKYQDLFEPHNISGMLLSRITLLMSSDPETGKALLKFVWEKLDELGQSNPGQYL
jgi:hypothetical protein